MSKSSILVMFRINSIQEKNPSIFFIKKSNQLLTQLSLSHLNQVLFDEDSLFQKDGNVILTILQNFLFYSMPQNS